MTDPTEPPFGQRPSHCADSAWREECRRLEGLTVWERPDENDPPGGVITIRGEGIDPIQIARPVGDPHALRVVDLAHLIALELHAGGRKSEVNTGKPQQNRSAPEIPFGTSGAP